MSIMAKRGKCFSCGHDHDAAPHWLAKLDQDQKKLKAATSKLAELQREVEGLRDFRQKQYRAGLHAGMEAAAKICDGQRGLDSAICAQDIRAAIDRSLSGGEG